ncbi:Structural maintenance of chromosomes protein 1 [Apophysomyces sp. BC1034]|nr:Structural maintenance of chromosomes protein 1 [Apophysomyces sp. BC1015]KAG0180592.1 Structural maintenance of chromosomes protein 1 [Apophysomyces sp. BC1021]KAG0187218.1 Structural maintenance of chromosomes protein 1 [Apophysomyces sp. BC1034]
MGRLIRIEIENFKSYKGHQIIGPFHKFTSVIGPNGSGKSNLMDAISFVLGVHSMHLRSQNLKDMIYRSSALQQTDDNNAVGSTNSRSPRSAYVMAVYENNQGNEIKFKRVARQSGQSEYYINNAQVPYSEYNEALEKENILVKAKNFLVFQGDVEYVASQDPKELTRLIEQISGSWEFKEEYDRLKLEQERAIERSAHAFNKKRNTAAEIKVYQAQKADAEKFETLAHERRQLVIQYLLWKLYHVEQKTHSLEGEANGKRIAANGATDDQNLLEEKFKEARKEKALIHRERTKKELQTKKIKTDLDEQRPSSISITEKITHLEKKLTQTKQNGERVKRDHDQQIQVVKTLGSDLEKLGTVVQSYEASLPVSSLMQGPTLTPEQLTEYDACKQQVSIRSVEEGAQLQTLERQQKLEYENVEHKKSKLDESKTRLSQLAEDKRQTTEDGNALTADFEDVTKQLEIRRQELMSLEQERKTVHQKEVELNEKLQETLNKLLEAKTEQRESEKEIKFRESLAMMKQIFPGVHGKLADLCRPTQRKYDEALAVILGRNMDAIVVEDQKTAIDCIQYMREQRVGAATFLPLNTLRIPVINDRFRNYTRGARLAFDVVNYEKQFEPVVQYVCGNALICDNLKIAKQICYEKKEDVRVVTLDGTVIHRSGLMTGGRSGSQGPKRWSQRDVEGLTRTRDKLLADLNELSKHKRMGSAEEIAKSDCAGLENQLGILQDEITTAKRKLDGIKDEARHVQEEISRGEQAYQEAKVKLDEVDATISQIKQTIALVEDQVFANLCAQIGISNIREYELQQFGLPQEVTERRSQFAAQRSRLEAQLSFEKEQLKELSERLEKLERVYANDTASLTQLQTEKVALNDNIQKMKVDFEKLNADLEQQKDLENGKQQEINQLRHDLEIKGKDVENYLKEMAKFETEIEKVHSERVTIFRKCKLEDIELPLIRGSMDDVLVEESHATVEDSNAMDVDEFSQRSIRSTDWMVEVDFSRLGSEQKDNGDTSLEREFQDEIKRRGEEIDQMAPNLKAIDRLEGIEQQSKDNEEEFNIARKEAKKAKEKFNLVKQKRYKRFYDAFSHISERIDQVYKDLTKSRVYPLGGTAYLTLEDSDEPYLEGIKYHAMPPTKRFRDMEKLSGGEKSVAALALLFAIHSYQPSPFFVLDEVDAALDNSNVSMVANYIREHCSNQFQFIVISLKSTLYEKAESLVGIYRDQDVNSSKTLTLMLDQYQPQQ